MRLINRTVNSDSIFHLFFVLFLFCGILWNNKLVVYHPLLIYMQNWLSDWLISHHHPIILFSNDTWATILLNWQRDKKESHETNSKATSSLLYMLRNIFIKQQTFSLPCRGDFCFNQFTIRLLPILSYLFPPKRLILWLYRYFFCIFPLFKIYFTFDNVASKTTKDFSIGKMMT